MKDEPLDCAQIRSGFVAGRVPAGPEVDDHLRACPHCRELFEEGAQLGRSLGGVPEPPLELGALLTSLEGHVGRERGLRAWLRALPTSVRVGALVALAVGLFALGLGFGRRPDFTQLSTGVFWLVIALLFGTFAFAARRLSRGVTLAMGSARRDRALTTVYLVAPAVALLLLPWGSPPEAAESWGNPEQCFVYGALLVAPLCWLAWLFERRDRVPVSTLVATGALAGIAANLLLCAHCSSAHLGHLLLGHASIGGAWALGLCAVGRS